MIIGVHHLGLACDRGKAAWLDHLAIEASPPWLTCANVRVLCRESEPSATTSPRPVALPGIAHICLQSGDINDGLERGKAAGLVPISRPVDLGTPFRYLYAHTSDGILLELEGAPFVRDLTYCYWVGHVAYVTRDIVSLVDFYARALGLSPSGLSRFSGNARIDQVAGLADVDVSAMWLPGLNIGLEFWQYHNPPPPSLDEIPATGFSHVCFQCNDFAADCARVLIQGAIQAEPLELDLNGCDIASFTDPEGNHFSLLAFHQAGHPLSVETLPNKGLLAEISAQLAASVAR